MVPDFPVAVALPWESVAAMTGVTGVTVSPNAPAA